METVSGQLTPRKITLGLGSSLRLASNFPRSNFPRTYGNSSEQKTVKNAKSLFSQKSAIVHVPPASKCLCIVHKLKKNLNLYNTSFWI